MSQCAQSLEWESSNALKKASLDTQHQGLNRLGFIYLVHTVQRRKTAPRRRQTLGSEGTLFEEKPKKTLIVFYVWKGTSNTDGPHVFWIPYQLNICVINNIYTIYIYYIIYIYRKSMFIILSIYTTYYVWYSFIIIIDILVFHVCGHSPCSRDVHARRHANSFRVVSKGRAWTPWALGTLTRVKVNIVVK